MVIFIIVTAIGLFISIPEFGVYNPYQVVSGLISLKIFNADIVLIQWSPFPSNSFKTVYITQPSIQGWGNIIALMKKRGYSYQEELRLGGLIVFKSDNSDKILNASVLTNRYCTIFSIFSS